MRKILSAIVLILFVLSSKAQVVNADVVNIRKSLTAPIGTLITDTTTNIASLKAKTTRPTVVHVRGYYTAGDGGGGDFVWYPTDTGTPEQGWIIQVTGVSTGRYKRVYNGGPLNVRWFGAYGDGVHDDRNAIQTAVEWAAILYPVTAGIDHPMSVYIPSGTYLLGVSNFANITLPPGTELFGDGQNSILVRKGGVDSNGYMMLIWDNIGDQEGLYSLYSDSTKNNYSIHDLQIVGMSAGVRDGVGIGLGNDGGIFIASATNNHHLNRVDIYNITARNFNKEAIAVWLTEHVNVHNNTVINSQFDAFNLTGKNVVMTNNIADSVNYCLEYAANTSFFSSSDTATTAFISGNKFTNVFEYGIQVEGGTYVNISNNYLARGINQPTTRTDQSYGIYVNPHSQSYSNANGGRMTQFIIDGNSITNFQYGIVQESVSTATNINRLIIKNNTISDIYYNAISLNSYDTTKITSTDISGNIFNEWDQADDGNTLFNAIYLSKIKNVNIFNNRFLRNMSTNRNDPVLLNNFADSIFFFNNVMPARYSNGNSGFKIYGGTGTFTNIYANGVAISPTAVIPSLTAASGSSGITRVVSAVSTNTSAGSAANTDYVYLVSGSTTITLPTAVGNTNEYTIKRVGTSNVTIATTSSQTIDGSSTAVLTVQYTSLTLVSDGSNWNIK